MNNITLHNDTAQTAHWIGVDLNTTGHPVVAAELVTGRVMKLGKRQQCEPRASKINCRKLYQEGKFRKLKKIKTRERKEFKVTLSKISRQIVSFAEASSAGIKFEKLFTYRYLHHRIAENPYEFSFENGSFISLLHLVEKRALSRGIPVLYVNPANTSKRCSRCGSFGRRVRKKFECPHCGAIIHADVNAAFNIAATAHTYDKFEIDWMRMIRMVVRRKTGEKVLGGESPRCIPAPDFSCLQKIPEHTEALQMIPGEG